jgi:hypothetical protein
MIGAEATFDPIKKRNGPRGGLPGARDRNGFNLVLKAPRVRDEIRKLMPRLKQRRVRPEHFAVYLRIDFEQTICHEPPNCGLKLGRGHRMPEQSADIPLLHNGSCRRVLLGIRDDAPRVVQDGIDAGVAEDTTCGGQSALFNERDRPTHNVLADFRSEFVSTAQRSVHDHQDTGNAKSEIRCSFVISRKGIGL